MQVSFPSHSEVTEFRKRGFLTESTFGREKEQADACEMKMFYTVGWFYEALENASNFFARSTRRPIE
ncbi:unnamed protein product [Sphenostylis stenocarpa]|uniref:Uncharacterized protein n=1 Tax=Sphenostylis stenocarpa TaxID=92480 RepID=A0AA86T197_9FABA|nr:unnamed protein product [Sphenostylis stenocarpa]